MAIKEKGLGGYKPNTPWMYKHPNVWTWLALEIGVKSVIDIGCAEGHVLKFFKFLGCKVHGVDGCKYAYNHNLVKENVALHDYRTGPYIPKDSYDLGWSHDFVEHVDEQYIPNYMDTFSKCSKYVCLSFAVKGCRGYHHVNTNDLPYWVDLFATRGFKPNNELTEQAKRISIDGGKLTPEILAAFPEVERYKDLVGKRDAHIFSVTRRCNRQSGIVFERM